MDVGLSYLTNDKELLYLAAPSLLKEQGLRHCFSTRLGGVSEGGFASLNLSFGRGDSDENVHKNFDILCEELGTRKEDIVFSKQTHDDVVAMVEEKDRGNGILRPNAFESADALVTASKNVALVGFFADCVPVLLYDPNKKVVAMVHSGWRGTVKNISAKTIQVMTECYGCRAADIMAVIGPSIGPCCFEVGDEVVDQFRKHFPSAADSIICDDGVSEKKKIDLWNTVAYTLRQCGVKDHNLTMALECTAHQNPLFFSHRAQGDERGGMIALIEMY